MREVGASRACLDTYHHVCVRAIRSQSEESSSRNALSPLLPHIIQHSTIASDAVRTLRLPLAIGHQPYRTSTMATTSHVLSACLLPFHVPAASHPHFSFLWYQLTSWLYLLISRITSSSSCPPLMYIVREFSPLSRKSDDHYLIPSP